MSTIDCCTSHQVSFSRRHQTIWIDYACEPPYWTAIELWMYRHEFEGFRFVQVELKKRFRLSANCFICFVFFFIIKTKWWKNPKLFFSDRFIQFVSLQCSQFCELCFDIFFGHFGCASKAILDCRWCIGHLKMKREWIDCVAGPISHCVETYLSGNFDANFVKNLVDNSSGFFLITRILQHVVQCFIDCKCK